MKKNPTLDIRKVRVYADEDFLKLAQKIKLTHVGISNGNKKEEAMNELKLLLQRYDVDSTRREDMISELIELFTTHKDNILT